MCGCSTCGRGILLWLLISLALVASALSVSHQARAVSQRPGNPSGIGGTGTLPAPDTLFVEGFESGDLSAWSDSVTPPVVQLTITPTSGRAPLTVRVDASASSDSDGSVEAFRWDFGDGSLGSGPVVLHEYHNPGSYAVLLLLVDDEGISARGAGTVQVLVEGPNLPPEPTFSPTSVTGVVPLTVTFDASGSFDPDGTLVGLFWTLGDGTSAQGLNVQHTYVEPGTYQVTLTAIDDQLATNTVGGTVVVEGPPNVDQKGR